MQTFLAAMIIRIGSPFLMYVPTHADGRANVDWLRNAKGGKFMQ